MEVRMLLLLFEMVVSLADWPIIELLGQDRTGRLSKGWVAV